MSPVGRRASQKVPKQFGDREPGKMIIVPSRPVHVVGWPGRAATGRPVESAARANGLAARRQRPVYAVNEQPHTT